MAQAPDDRSGMGVILGIFIAVLLVIGGYFMIQAGNTDNAGVTANTASPVMPDESTAEPAAGNDISPTPAPGQAQ